ncbi:hypothetical protein KC340_g113 [Hortaea werneckii]|nr:hypothetical protein KC340_g113 [Hortaea werneckii]
MSSLSLQNELTPVVMPSTTSHLSCSSSSAIKSSSVTLIFSFHLLRASATGCVSSIALTVCPLGQGEVMFSCLGTEVAQNTRPKASVALAHPQLIKREIFDHESICSGQDTPTTIPLDIYDLLGIFTLPLLNCTFG